MSHYPNNSVKSAMNVCTKDDLLLVVLQDFKQIKKIIEEANRDEWNHLLHEWFRMKQQMRQNSNRTDRGGSLNGQNRIVAQILFGRLGLVHVQPIGSPDQKTSEKLENGHSWARMYLLRSWFTKGKIFIK